MPVGPSIVFRLDTDSGVPAYRQLIDQVVQAIRLGFLLPGDQLPTVRDVVKQIAINPNTVHRAYRDLEQRGFAEGRQGSGTFIRTPPAGLPAPRTALLRDLESWIGSASQAGLDVRAMRTIFDEAIEPLERGDRL
jgi:GntR family transcriptional regulator